MLASVGGAIGAVVGTLLLLILLRTVRAAPRESGSRFVLEYGKPMRGLGVAMLLLGAFIVYAASRSSLDQRALAWFVSGVLAAGALYVFLEVFLVRIEFDDSFIYPFSPWRGHRCIPWSDISSFSFSETNRWFVVRTGAHGSLRVSTFLSGIGSFVERLHENAQA